MRLMLSTALASAVLFAAPALAGGDYTKSTSGMGQPESSAAQIPGTDKSDNGTSGMSQPESSAAQIERTAAEIPGIEAGELRANLAAAGFTGLEQLQQAQVFQMRTTEGLPVWVLLMPQDVQLSSSGQTGSGASGSMSSSDRSQASDTSQSDRQNKQASASGQSEGSMGSQNSGVSGASNQQGFAAEIPSDLREKLQSSGFKQFQSVGHAAAWRGKTEDGRVAFFFAGDIQGAGGGSQNK